MHTPFVGEKNNLVLKVPEEILHVIQLKITASSNTEYTAVSFSMDFTVKKTF